MVYPVSAQQALSLRMASLGFNSPLKRAVAVATGVSVVLFLTQPAAFFEPDGSPRPAAASKDPRTTSDAAVIPWWALSLSAGVAAAFFL